MYCLNKTKIESILLNKAKAKALEADPTIRTMTDGKIIVIALKAYLDVKP